jgi:uncharacterized protein YpiB (UPF0302 family)
MTNLDSNPLQTKSVDSDELAYIKHNAMLTEMIAADHDIIMALRQEILTMREIMTQEQMAELRELLLKSQQATEASRTNQSKHLTDPEPVSPAQSSQSHS